jgi:aryl-alcohol dehydrogenase-like predicted oxidoreductase
MITLWDGTEIPRLGLGCWAIGGPFTIDGVESGWGATDDETSLAAIRAGVEAGIRFFDTAQAYGAGHSETLLGKALYPHPQVRIATKIGLGIDTHTRRVTGLMTDPDAIEASIEASCRRLRRDRIDLVLLHLNALPIVEAEPIFDRLETLRAKGRIAAFGWSTDYPDRAAAFADRPGFAAVEHAMNVFFRAEAQLPVVEAQGCLSLNRSPLAMGLLGGHIVPGHRFAADDIRGSGAGWLDYYKDGTVSPTHASMLADTRDLLMTDGRSLAQGALCWLMARSPRALPIPGFRSVAQVVDLAGAIDKGALPASVMAEIEAVILREPEGPPRDR